MLSVAVVSIISMLCSTRLGAHTDVLDARALPLGDGKVSTSPRRGYVFACNTAFHGGGAQHAGAWIHGSTWDVTSKLAVQGEVAWPDAVFAVSVVNGQRRLTGNGLPLEHTTGTFPVGRNDPAFAIDRNPNRIHAQQIALSLPLTPTLASAAQCVPMGMIGVALSGVAIFNALDAAGRDAVAHEVQDRCNGHPQREGQYHYHGPTPCLLASASNNELIGFALDGFGIYSAYDENGKELTNADLDECHGRVSRIQWNGRPVTMYHYVLTREYPYTVGCFRGTPARAAQSGAMQPQEGQRPGDEQRQAPSPNGSERDPSSQRGADMLERERGASRRPPPEAIAACAGLSDNSQCRFISPRGDPIAGTCRSPDGALACVPMRR
jgi:hypothetical protein